jgi:hypothetical protein
VLDETNLAGHVLKIVYLSSIEAIAIYFLPLSCQHSTQDFQEFFVVHWDFDESTRRWRRPPSGRNLRSVSPGIVKGHAESTGWRQYTLMLVF